jgi:hypothetical protein
MTPMTIVLAATLTAYVCIVCTLCLTVYTSR